MSPADGAAVAPDAPMQFVDVQDHRLRVRVDGSGPTLLMLNGIGANIEVWEPLRRLLDARRLIAFDAPGAGASPPSARRLRMPDIADLVAGLLDRLECDRADVLGYSWGGALAQQFAHQHPARVRRLILAATVPGLGGVQSPRRVMQMMDPRLQREPSARRSQRVAELVGGRSGSDPAVLAIYERNRAAHPPTPEGYRQQLRTLTGWSSMRWLSKLQASTLVLAGEHDPLVPAINGRIFTRLIPDCRRYVVRGGGHLFLIDQPEDVVGVIDSFLSAPDPPFGAPPRAA